MKVLAFILYAIGFTFQYTIPLVLFGRVIPLSTEGVSRGLTGVGLFVVCIFATIIIGRIKGRIREMQKGFIRALLLVVTKALPVIVITAFIDWLGPFVDTLTEYWADALSLIITGWLFDVFAEVIESYTDKEADA